MNKKLVHNEDSRVKIPALLHLTRLGYTFLPRSKMKNIHPDTNIFVDEFKKGISKINDEEYTDSQAKGFIREINAQLENDDLGKVFYESLLGDFDCKLIDLEDFDNNTFSIVTELTYKNGEDEFRPDITVLINGMPLIFIEVKKPNNREGILAERNRIDIRCKNKKFKKFMNITQLLIFSNNNEYEEDAINPIQGAFYATPDPEKVKFNFFREEDKTRVNSFVSDINNKFEREILKDTNLVSILGSKEYATNKNVDSPTNRILTSMLNKERIGMILRYGIAYVNTVEDMTNKIEKHIMRYPQIFATLAIKEKLEEKKKKGIIWHTQGSGKTALAYFNVHYLTDYYQKKNIVAKFYFITDRLDLATQAKNEFESRGLKVDMISSKEDFIKNIKTPGAISGTLGARTISVVNIQKFSSESISEIAEYDLNVQRVYFLDEVHRSYNPRGSFLSNLVSSDRNAVLIGLTGTPLILGDVKSKQIFGDYIHKYYYNKSIADGYTLRLIREGIKTKFRNDIKNILDEIRTKKGSLTKKQVFSHPKFTKPLTKYIIDDFKDSRVLHNDSSIGGMIVCDSSEQARGIFNEIKKYDKSISSALILHDEDDKKTRKELQTEFKQGKIDFLVVYNMLLTGFDAKRLKKMYLTRVVKQHNLLQTLTRVNRPYKKFRYGYVVDFADIRKEFDKTNKEYFKELQNELGDEAKNYSNFFKSAEEIDTEIKEIKEKLFLYDFSNLEEFQKVISQISDKKEILNLKSALDNLKSLYNIIKLKDYAELKDRFSFEMVNKLFNEVSNRLNIINLKSNLENAEDSSHLLNIALEEMQFTFTKISEHEMVIADKFRMELERTRKELENNFDKKDPSFVSLLEELKRLFKKKSIEELDSKEMKEAVSDLKDIYTRAHALNIRDSQLSNKYENDNKFARIHKRVQESENKDLKRNVLVHDILLDLKYKIDNYVLDNQDVINTGEYFSEVIERETLEILESKGIKNLEAITLIHDVLIKEYLEERI
jgi:type I restriction enzyme, R subunit